MLDLNKFNLRSATRMAQAVAFIVRTHAPERLEEYQEAIKHGRHFHLKAKADSFMPVTIEVQSAEYMGYEGSIVIVEHTFLQNGDLMSDPRMDFFATTANPKSGGWFPFRTVMSPMGMDREYLSKSSDTSINIANRLYDQAVSFSTMWASNLRDQLSKNSNVEVSI